MQPAGSTRGPITFYWVGVGTRSIASFAALDALFQMGIGSGGRLQGMAALEPKFRTERVQKIPQKSGPPPRPQNFGQKRPEILD